MKQYPYTVFNPATGVIRCCVILSDEDQPKPEMFPWEAMIEVETDPTRNFIDADGVTVRVKPETPEEG